MTPRRLIFTFDPEEYAGSMFYLYAEDRGSTSLGNVENHPSEYAKS
jgi:hypothetical protein